VRRLVAAFFVRRERRSIGRAVVNSEFFNLRDVARPKAVTSHSTPKSDKSQRFKVASHTAVTIGTSVKFFVQRVGDNRNFAELDYSAGYL